MTTEHNDEAMYCACSPADRPASVPAELRNCSRCCCPVWVAYTSLQDFEERGLADRMRFLCASCTIDAMKEEAREGGEIRIARPGTHTKNELRHLHGIDADKSTPEVVDFFRRCTGAKITFEDNDKPNQ